MTIKASTGLRNGMLASSSLKALMEAGDGMKLRVYAGAAPATADAAIPAGATLLCELSDDASGGGLLFDTAAVDGVLGKDPDQVWRGVNVASGTASFYRLIADGDDGSLSTTQPRIQGSIGVAGEDMNLSDVALEEDADQRITHFVLNLPTL